MQGVSLDRAGLLTIDDIVLAEERMPVCISQDLGLCCAIGVEGAGTQDTIG